ncbi:protein kinase [Mycoplasmatota bacterium WC44]
MLKIGEKVKAVYLNSEYEVLDVLGSGGQGEVYKVRSSSGTIKALKWYFKDVASNALYDDVNHLVLKQAPSGHTDTFAWPLDICFKKENKYTFGYLMDLIDLNDYYKFREIQANPNLAPNYKKMVEVMLNIVESFSIVHLAGLCYRDISLENIVFSPSEGTIRIFDNDNIGNNYKSKSHILGTKPFMAPEVFKGEQTTDEATDLYSLAIVLFQLMCWNHPYHGKKYYEPKIISEKTTDLVYGKPVFIFDPDNKSNELIEEKNPITKVLWKSLTKDLQDLFIRSFTDGINNRSARVSPKEWRDALTEIYEGIEKCMCGEYYSTKTSDNNKCIICNL